MDAKCQIVKILPIRQNQELIYLTVPYNKISVWADQITIGKKMAAGAVSGISGG
jgi:hypothetical protein